jgi:hypothetical protein
MATTRNENSIECQESDYLYVKSSQIENAGMGLYTAIDLFKDETVAVFLGEVLSADEATRRASEGFDLYFICMLDGRIMDSMHVSCMAKFANDASAGGNSLFKNNMHITFNESNEICLTATKNVKANEELFCSYGAKYWKKHKGFLKV